MYNNISHSVILLARGANVNERNTSGRTPLCIASYYGCKEIIITLLTHSADINMKNIDGWTPLHIASANGYKELVMIAIVGSQLVCTYRME
jgi:ankyrin repeat protein